MYRNVQGILTKGEWGFLLNLGYFSRDVTKVYFHGISGVVQYFIFVSASYILIFEKIRQMEIINRNCIYGKSVRSHTMDYTGLLLII